MPNFERGVVLNRHEKIYKYTIGISLLLYILLIFIVNIISPDKVFSQSENRVLEQCPKFSLENIQEGKFTGNFQKYISDQFVLRNFFIGIKSECEKIIGKKENNGVYLAKDGCLIEKFKTPDENKMKENIELINSFNKKTSKINKYFMLVPNAVKILEDKLPANHPDKDQLIYINEFKNNLDRNIKFIDLYDTLYSKKDDYIFYKTDHHWTTKGAYYAYNKFCRDIGLKPYEEKYFKTDKVSDEFYGSLYSKSGFRHIKPDSIDLYKSKVNRDYKVKYFQQNKVLNSLYNMEALNKKDKYTVFFGGNFPLIKITTNSNKGKKLLVVKDSYANSFIPFLTEHYDEIYVVDLRYYKESLKELLNSQNIKDMLFLYNANSYFESFPTDELS